MFVCEPDTFSEPHINCDIFPDSLDDNVCTQVHEPEGKCTLSSAEYVVMMYNKV